MNPTRVGNRRGRRGGVGVLKRTRIINLREVSQRINALHHVARDVVLRIRVHRAASIEPTGHLSDVAAGIAVKRGIDAADAGAPQERCMIAVRIQVARGVISGAKNSF